MAPLDISVSGGSFKGLCIGGEEALSLWLSKNGLEGRGRNSLTVSEASFLAVEKLGCWGRRSWVNQGC